MFSILSLGVLLSSLVGSASSRSALIIIDVQTCFLPGGSLAVTDGHEVIPVINKIRSEHDKDFALVVKSQDFHCPGHVSFYTNHPGRKVMDTVPLSYTQDGHLCTGGSVSSQTFPGAVACSSVPHTLTQVLWPPHCISDVTDPKDPTSAALADSLHESPDDIILKKGTNCELDAYSAFFDNGGWNSTGLEKTLRAAGVDTVFITGLAQDYCVNWTAHDAVRLGFETYTVLDATRGVAEDTSGDARLRMMANGVHLIESYDIKDILQAPLILSAAPATVPVMTVTVSMVTMSAVMSALATL